MVNYNVGHQKSATGMLLLNHLICLYLSIACLDIMLYFFADELCLWMFVNNYLHVYF